MVALSWYCIPFGPLGADSSKFFGSPFVKLKLSIKELGERSNCFSLGLFDVLHSAEHIFLRFFKFTTIHANLFLDLEVVSAGFVELGGASIVGKSTAFQLLARSLGVLVD